MRRLATFIHDHHEPVTPQEFRLFALVGVVLALALMLSYSAAAWSQARTAPTAGYHFAQR